MKHAKQRVIAIDYFRGLCILIVLLSHSALFSMPFAYLSGLGQLWTSAAEMFFLLSGITFVIVRGSQASIDFKAVIRKSWARAGKLYILNLLLVTYAIVLGYLLIDKGLTYYIPENLPAQHGLPLLINLLILKVPLGWADFLMYYPVFLLLAPFTLRVLRSRFWPAVLIVSLSIFLMQGSMSEYGNFALWQFYFFLGMTISQFRQSIIGAIYNLPPKLLVAFRRTIYVTAATVLGINIFSAFYLYPYVNRLTIDGWLPIKLRSAYIHLLNNQHSLDFWLRNSRTGPLRPIVALLVLMAAYLLYQSYKQPLLKYTGKVVNRFGSDTLYVYSAQALLLPLIAALPLHYGHFWVNLPTTALFFYGMWLVTQRRRILQSAQVYIDQLKLSYNESKHSYLQQYEDS